MRIKDLSFCGINFSTYSLRIDLPDNYHEPASMWFDNIYMFLQNKFKYMLVGREKSNTGKRHLQCFAMTESPLPENELLKIRHYIKTHLANKTTKQPVSLKKSWSPLGLFTYCQKEGDIKHNMPHALFDHLVTLADFHPDSRPLLLQQCAQRATTLQDLVFLLCQLVNCSQLRIVPRKSEVWRLALAHNLIDFDTFFQEFYAPRTL